MPQFFRLSRLLLSMATHLGGLLAAERWVRFYKGRSQEKTLLHSPEFFLLRSPLD